MSELSEVEDATVAAVEIVEDVAEEEITARHPVMTEAEARQCIEAIKGYVVSIRALLLELEERQGWKALGYSSMTACLVGEFPGESKTKLIRALEAGRIERHQQVPIGTYLESQLRPLFKFSSEQWKPILAKAHQLAGEQRLTASHVTQAATEFQSVQLSQIKPVAPPVLSYQVGDIVLVECAGSVQEPYARYSSCWGLVADVHSYGCKVQLMGQKWNIHWNDLKEIDLVDETLKQVAEHIVILLEREVVRQERVGLILYEVKKITSVPRSHALSTM